MTIDDNVLQDKMDTRTSNVNGKDPMYGKYETCTLQNTSVTVSCILIKFQTQVTLMEVMLNAYTDKFRVNQSNFDEEIGNTINSAMNNALKGFTDSTKFETSCADSILVNIKKIITDGLDSGENVDMNIENLIKTEK